MCKAQYPYISRLIAVLDKLSSGTSKMRKDKNKIIKFHGTEVNNVIIHYTISKGSKKEFDASKIKLQFETVNVQIVADYITITFYKDEHSNLILQREMIPAHRVEYIWVKDS